jgi:uncharacterized protein (DUF427 family)
VWDYPRPPACVPSRRLVTVHAGTRLVARSTRAVRVLETSHPPTWYIPLPDVAGDALRPSAARPTFCEFKGVAEYLDVVDDADRVLPAAAWHYPAPSPGYDAIAGHVAFVPRSLTCRVDGLVVGAQAGGFYAGWITPDVVGPFKGGPGTAGW